MLLPNRCLEVLYLSANHLCSLHLDQTLAGTFLDSLVHLTDVYLMLFHGLVCHTMICDCAMFLR